MTCLECDGEYYDYEITEDGLCLECFNEQESARYQMQREDWNPEDML